MTKISFLEEQVKNIKHHYTEAVKDIYKKNGFSSTNKKLIALSNIMLLFDKNPLGHICSNWDDPNVEDICYVYNLWKDFNIITSSYNTNEELIDKYSSSEYGPKAK
jgi:hypothetical protein